MLYEVITLLFLGTLQGGELIFRQHNAFLGDLGLQSLETFLKDLQVMSEPDASNSARRDKHALLTQFVAHPNLAPGRLVNRKLDDVV